MAADELDPGSTPSIALQGPESPIDSDPQIDTAPQIDVAKAAAMFEQLVERQNLPLGIAAGFVAAIVGAIAWAVVTNLTGFQIGWMAIGIGCLVGFAIRTVGQGLTKSFGIAGGVLSLFGCLLGNLLAVCGMVATGAGTPIVSTTLGVLANPAMIVEVIAGTFHPMDALFYAIAVYEGFKFSFRQVSPEELQAMIS